MPQKKKHLLLLNRIIRAETKKDIIPVPSKLSEDEVDKYFKQLFVKKDDYYVPIKNKLEIAIDEKLFEELIKKPKVKVVKTKEDKEAMKEMKKVEQAKNEEDMRISVFNTFTRNFIKPYLEKRKSGANVSKDEKELTDRYNKLSINIKKMIEKASPKLWETVLNPTFKEYEKRKEQLSMEAKQQMKDIRKKAQDEKRMLKKTKVEE